MSVHKKCIPKVIKNCRGTSIQNNCHGNETNLVKQKKIDPNLFALNR